MESLVSWVRPSRFSVTVHFKLSDYANTRGIIPDHFIEQAGLNKNKVKQWNRNKAKEALGICEDVLLRLKDLLPLQGSLLEENKELVDELYTKFNIEEEPMEFWDVPSYSGTENNPFKAVREKYLKRKELYHRDKRAKVSDDIATYSQGAGEDLIKAFNSLRNHIARIKFANLQLYLEIRKREAKAADQPYKVYKAITEEWEEKVKDVKKWRNRLPTPKKSDLPYAEWKKEDEDEAFQDFYGSVEESLTETSQELQTAEIQGQQISVSQLKEVLPQIASGQTSQGEKIPCPELKVWANLAGSLLGDPAWQRILTQETQFLRQIIENQEAGRCESVRKEVEQEGS